MRILSRADVEAALDLDLLVDALADALADVSLGRASIPSRIAARIDRHDAILGAMPGYLPSSGTLMTKLVSVFPHNTDQGLESHQAVIAMFDPDTGTPLALMDATHITAVRTAAGSALSARLLARDDASILAILGTGVQATTHAHALPRVRPIREIRVAGRDPARARALAGRLARDLGGDVRIVAAPSFADAMAGAHVVAACTHAAEPVIRREWVEPGMHLTSVGVNAEGPEVDARTVADARVVVESRAAALAPYPAGAVDLLGPIREGLITEGHIHAEIGELVLGTKAGRTSADQITLYKSVGIAAEDAAAARLAMDAADAKGLGASVEL